MKFLFLIVLITSIFGCVRSFDNKSFHDGKNKVDRFVVENEIVKDSATGLMWQKEIIKRKTWDEGKKYCKDLTLTGFSDWRLPTISELRTLVLGCPTSEIGGTCNVADDCNSFICSWDKETHMWEMSDSSNEGPNYKAAPDRKCYCAQKGEECYWDSKTWGKECASLISSTEKTYIKESHLMKTHATGTFSESGDNEGWHWYLSYKTGYFRFGKESKDGEELKCVRDLKK
jgi:hypothetical protein